MLLWVFCITVNILLCINDNIRKLICQQPVKTSFYTAGFVSELKMKGKAEDKNGNDTVT